MKKLTLFLLTILTCINLFIFFKRDNFTYTKQSAYFELYPQYKDLNIQSFEMMRDSFLKVVLHKNSNVTHEWLTTNNSTSQVTRTASVDPVISLQPGIAGYTIQSKNFKDSLTLEVEYIPAAWLTSSGKKQTGRTTVFHSYLPSASASLTKWKQNKIPASSAELAIIKNILKDSIRVNVHDYSLTKAQKITEYLCRKISASKGIMSDSVQSLSVCDQYNAALAGNKIDCGVYANIFSVFATEAGIVNRIIEIKHRYGTFHGNIHLFNEYYVHELKQWVATDLMLNNINYYNGGGKLLNGVEIKNLSATDSITYVTHASIVKDSVTMSKFSLLPAEFFNYYGKDKDLYYYYTNNPTDIYSSTKKWKRYFFNNSWYELYSDVSIVDNKAFYIKQIFIVSWIIIFIIFLASLLFGSLPKK